MKRLTKVSRWSILSLGILVSALCLVPAVGCAPSGEQSEVSAKDAAVEKADQNVDQPEKEEGLESQSNADEPENSSVSETPDASEVDKESVTPYKNDAQTAPEAMANLGVQVLRELDTSGENVMISPYSLTAALGLLANGADGETKAELEGLLGLPVAELNEAYVGYQALSEPVAFQSDDVEEVEATTIEQRTFSDANSLWLGKEFTPKSAFLNLATTDYKAEVETLDGFSDGKIINEWANEHTNGLIPAIVPDNYKVNPQGMDLINAIVFECAWEDPYSPLNGTPGIFTSLEGDSQEVDFLYSIEKGYLESPFATGFVKPYADTRFAFAALLPREGTTPEELLNEISGEELRAVLEDADMEQDVSVAMVEFENRYVTELNDVLKTLGVKSAFEEDEANFSGITAGPLWLDSVLQSTYVLVDKAGTKAAAITSEKTDGAAPIEDLPPEVHLNRPFVYVIYETESITPLFIGIVNSLE